MAESVKKEAEGGLSREELEKHLLERTDELDELKEKFDELNFENEQLRVQNSEM